MGQLVLVRSIEKMELHVYYYPILILFLANSASAILQRQKELQAFGDLFGVTSDSDDNLESIFQDQPQQSLRQQPGLNFGNFDDLNQFLNPKKLRPIDSFTTIMKTTTMKKIVSKRLFHWTMW